MPFGRGTDAIFSRDKKTRHHSEERSDEESLFWSFLREILLHTNATPARNDTEADSWRNLLTDCCSGSCSSAGNNPPPSSDIPPEPVADRRCGFGRHRYRPLADAAAIPVYPRSSAPGRGAPGAWPDFPGSGWDRAAAFRGSVPGDRPRAPAVPGSPGAAGLVRAWPLGKRAEFL